MTTTPRTRTPLNRDRVLRAAIEFADEHGIEALSMRKLGTELGVEAMSLYNHVKKKDDLLNGMVDAVLEEIDMTRGGTDWQSCVRHRILSARETMVRHQWAAQLIETRKDMSPAMIGYFDGMVGMFREGGFSLDLIHHAMHALGSRMLGFTQELFDDNDDLADNQEVAAILMQQMTEQYPNISAMLAEITHEGGGDVVGNGCDDQVEFEFGLDLILNGLERLRAEEAAAS